MVAVQTVHMTETRNPISIGPVCVLATAYLIIAPLRWLIRTGVRHIPDAKPGQTRGYVRPRKVIARLELDPTLPRSLRKDGWWLET